MADGKTTNDAETGTAESNVNELARIVNSHMTTTSSMSSPVSSTTSSARTYTPPLMGTSARAAKRRMDSDSIPIRLEGTDTYNQQLQHHYQNVRNILEGQEQQQVESGLTNIDSTADSKQSFSAKRDFFEQRFKTPPPTYDCPPRQQQTQKIITTITTTTKATSSSSNMPDRTSSSSNESPSVDRVLEQAVELQKMSNINGIKNESQVPLIIERSEEYQVFLDSANHEVRRTPSISRTSIIQSGKTGHATDLDQAQAEVGRLTDDHEAIQHLTRVLQEHNVANLNEYKRLPSQTSQNPTALSTVPSDILVDRTNLQIKNDFSVIDALVNNPIGTDNDNYNNMLNKRSNDIMTNLRNPEYLNVLKESTMTKQKSKKKQKEKKPVEKKSTEKKPKEKKVKEKKPKEKKSKEKKSKQPKSDKNPLITDDTIERATVRSHINTSETATSPTVEPVTTSVLSEQTPLIDPKEKTKQDKENKKTTKTKSKQKSKTEDYRVVDAIISSPISLRLPESYLTKYHASPPSTLSSPLQSLPPPPPPPPSVTSNPVVTTTGKTSTTSKETKADTTNKNPALHHLINIVGAIQSHHTTAMQNSLNTESSKMDTKVQSKQSIPIVNRQNLTEQQRPVSSSNRAETNLPSEPVKPRIIYRYMDEQGRILKISSVAPSELREEPAHQYAYHTGETPYLYGRHIATDDERRHPLSQYEQHATWQGEPKLPMTLTREDFELRDKRVPHLSDAFIPPGRTIPVPADHERSSRPSSQQQPRTYHYPSQQTVKLAWLPLSYPPEQALPGGATAGYDTDSTISERSAPQRPFEYGPNDSYYRHPNRPYYNDYYYNRSPGPIYPRNPQTAHYGGRGISPEYGGISRNYIEVFRGGDFRETKPSEIYSLPLSEQIRTSPNFPSSSRHSRYDQYQSEKYGTISNRNHTPSSQTQQFYYSNSLPKSRYQANIPATVHGSSYYTHHSPYQNHTVQSSPNPECRSSIRQSKSFDYRPLRTKLQREYKITPNLLVDEWEYPPTNENTKYSTATSATHQSSGVSSPDDVFISSRTNKA